MFLGNKAHTHRHVNCVSSALHDITSLSKFWCVFLALTASLKPFRKMTHWKLFIFFVSCVATKWTHWTFCAFVCVCACTWGVTACVRRLVGLGGGAEILVWWKNNTSSGYLGLPCQPYGVHIYYVLHSKVNRPITEELGLYQPDVRYWVRISPILLSNSI